MSNDQHSNPGGPNKDHDFNIIVNGRPKKVADEVQTFDSIAALSGLPTGPDTIFTITYRNSHDKRAVVMRDRTDRLRRKRHVRAR